MVARKFHYLNAAPINEISERWIDQYDQHRVHADFEPGSVVAELVSGGGPLFLSALKTLLETGESLRRGPQPIPRSGCPL